MAALPAGTVPRTALALAVVVGVLAFAHLVVPHWSTRYASYLIAFTVWMAWFVEVVVGWLRQGTESP